MPTPCVIRFTDDKGENQAHVRRKQHSHPEDVITNLSSLKIVIDRYRERPPPGEVAVQFLFLDTLWYALREVQIDELEDELRKLLYSPVKQDIEGKDSYLRQHAFLDSATSIDAVSFLYEVELAEPDWQVSIGHNENSFSGPVDEVFELVSWDFSGELDEALGRFQ